MIAQILLTPVALARGSELFPEDRVPYKLLAAALEDAASDGFFEVVSPSEAIDEP